MRIRRSSGPTRAVLAVAAATATLLLGACAGDGGPADAAPVQDCPDGTTAVPPSGPDALPLATLSVLGEDRDASTACWLGRPLVVNFWAEWCGPCRAEMPDFEQVHRAAGDRVTFVGVDYEDRPQAAIDFAAEVGVTYRLVEDPDGGFFDALDGRGTPYTLLVDAGGTIVHRHAGPLSREALEQLLADVLDVRV